MWITEEHIRPKSSFHLQYIIVVKEESPINIFPPEELNNPFLKIIAQLPKTLVQLDGRTTDLIASEWLEKYEMGYDISVVFDYNLETLLPRLSARQITIIFIGDDVNAKKVLELFSKYLFRFYYFSKRSEDVNSFSSPFEMVDLLQRDKIEISAHFQAFGLNVNFEFYSDIPSEFKMLNRYVLFIPSLSNFFMLNQYIGNLWHDKEYIYEIINVTEEQHLEDLGKASAMISRMDILVEQIRNIDAFRSTFVEGVV